MLGSDNPLKPRAVRVANTEAANQGKPQTVVSVSKAQMYIVAFYDERGRPDWITVMDVEGQGLMAARNSIEWTRDLKPASKWLRDQLKNQIRATTPIEPDSLPSKDEVDVMGEDGDDEDEPESDPNPIAARIADESEARRQE